MAHTRLMNPPYGKPNGVEELAAGLVGALVGVGAAEVALCLGQVRGEDGVSARRGGDRLVRHGIVQRLERTSAS